MINDLYGGRYSVDEVERILEINARPDPVHKPDQAYYKKNALEHGPSWAEKRDFVHWLIHESNITLSSKSYLIEN